MRRQLEDLLAEFVERRERGDAIDPASFAAEHGEPEMAEALTQLAATESLLPHADALPARLGEFRVVRELGRGAFARVLHVERHGRPLALKLIAASALGPRALQRLRREGLALQRLDDPHIVRVVEVGESEDAPYLAMELVDGPSLGGLVEAAVPVEDQPGCAALGLPGTNGPFARVAILVACVARAVATAHAHGVLHRDVKPANVVLDATRGPVLLDFGLTNGEGGPTLTATGDVVGTPCSMAPEQALGRPATPQTDVYGLGALLYELIALQPPHRLRPGSDPVLMLEAVRRRLPAPLHRLEPRLPTALATIQQRAMARVPRRRYATAAELALDLDRFVRGEQIAARPPGMQERIADVCHQRGRTIAAAVALAVIATLAAALWLRGSDRAALHRHAERRLAAAWLEREDAALREQEAALAETHGAEALLTLVRALRSGGDVPPDGGGPPWVAALAEAERHRRAQDHDRALEALRTAARLAPGSPLVAVMLGTGARRAGVLDVAEAELTAAMRLLPSSAAVRRELAAVYQARRRFDEVPGLLRGALELAPDDWRLWGDLGRAHYDLGKYDRGLRAIERAVELAGDDAPPALVRRHAHLLDKNERYEEAQLIYRRLLERHPHNVRDLFGLASSLDSAHRLREAHETYLRVLDERPDDGKALASLAYLRAGSNRARCADCARCYRAQPELIDPDAAERWALAALDADRGRQPGVVETVVLVARQCDRRTAVAARIDVLEREAFGAGDDERLLRLRKSRLTLQR